MKSGLKVLIQSGWNGEFLHSSGPCEGEPSPSNRDVSFPFESFTGAVG